MKTQTEKEKIEREIEDKRINYPCYDVCGNRIDDSAVEMIKKKLLGFNLAKECVLEDVEEIIDEEIKRYEHTRDSCESQELDAIEELKQRLEELKNTESKEAKGE